MNRFGYLGTETALNGLRLWIHKNYELRGSAVNRDVQIQKLVVEYGESNIPNFKKKGHLYSAANIVAKRIQRNNKFNDFTAWVDKKFNSEQKDKRSVATGLNQGNEDDKQIQ